MSEGHDQSQGGAFGESGGRERSDLFSVGKADQSIPKLDEIPETPEERKRRHIIRGTLAAVATVIAITVALVALHLWTVSQIRTAALEATDDGRAASFTAALDLLEGEDDPASVALRAMLQSARGLEHGEPESMTKARELLKRLSGKDARRQNALVASTYVSLSAGEPRAAWKVASPIAPAGTYAAEAARAVSKAALAKGDVAQARKSAQLALDQRPGAPRHASWLALVTARAARRDEALAVLDELGEQASGSPAVTMARARILYGRRDSQEAALKHARRVLETDGATPTERAWGHLLLARDAAARAKHSAALGELRKATKTRPPGDERFTLARIDTLLEAKAVDNAVEALGTLPDGVSTNAARRAQVAAAAALAQGDLTRAETHLEKAPRAPRTMLLRARLAEAQGDHARAAELYRDAGDTASLRPEAYRRLAAMKLDQGDTAEALELMKVVLEHKPAHPETVPLAVRAYVGEGQTERAMELAQGALDERPGHPRLLAARAHVEMATERWKDALGTLETALEKETSDADLYANLGEAARHLDRTDRARKAYEQARELDASHPTALVGLVELAVDAENLERAKKVLEDIDAADIVSHRVDVARARYLVMSGAGSEGVRPVRKAIIRRAKKDAFLWKQLGWLQMQAENYSGAAYAFGRALRYKEGDPEGLAGSALAHARYRRIGAAERELEDAHETTKDQDVGSPVRALFHVVQGYVYLAEDKIAGARREARRALRRDGECSEAHLLLAHVSLERERDPVEHLRAALEGRRPPPEAKGLLAVELASGEEACRLGQEYRERTSSGRHGRKVYRVLRECR